MTYDLEAVDTPEAMAARIRAAAPVRSGPGVRYTEAQRHAVIAAAIEAMPDGMTLTALAAAAGVTSMTIRAWLLGSVPEQYKHLQEKGLIARILEADDRLDAATTMLDVNKADRSCKYMRWDAERRLKGLFAQSTELAGPGQKPLEVMDTRELARRVAFVLEKGRRSGAPDEIVVEAGDREDFSDLA